MSAIERYFAERGWEPLPYQREVWAAMARGESGLVHSSTGSGKTLSVWMGFLPLIAQTPGLKAIWLTPLRSLATDTLKSLTEAAEGTGTPLRIELRTGDTSSSVKARQAKDAPDVLITTPESLTLMLTQTSAPRLMAGLQLLVVDEWHELLGTKRGVQTELAIARVRNLAPGIRTWGLSATLGNTEIAGRVLVPTGATLIQGAEAKPVTIDTLVPPDIERFPWAGHIGTRMVPQVVKELDQVQSCLVFTNTRAQAEIWHQAILDQKPSWADAVGLHHGSLDKEVRQGVEEGLKSGRLRCVVCTSSLDLGVDFSPVDRVFQVGSPKGVARLLQRAGRSGHQPGATSRVTCVPTHALELLDIAAAREAAERRAIEGREPLESPLDVLAQHLVSMALAGGFREDKLKAEVRTTYAYRHLTDDEWKWAMDYITTGGETLRAYPDFRRVDRDGDIYLVRDKGIAARHRMNVGTIVSDGMMTVKYLTGGALGSVEESFASRLKKGDVFLFAGRALSFVMVKDMTCYVRKATSTKGVVPRWGGGRMPLSTELAAAVRRLLDRIHYGELGEYEVQAMRPLLRVQADWSAIPHQDEWLVEQVQSYEGHHMFFYPVEGRLVHMGLAALFAYRLSRHTGIAFSVACNDYGFELLGDRPVNVAEAIENGLLDAHELGPSILESLNATEMAKRQFREIARVAGLVLSGYPGQPRSTRQIQASSGLFYDVFRRYDPGHPLLRQADHEVLTQQLEELRLERALRRLRQARLILTQPPRPTPFAFPILVDRLRETVGLGSVEDRIQRLVSQLEAAV